MGSLCVICVPLPLDYPRCKIKTHSCCVDAELTLHWRSFSDMVTIWSCAFLPRKLADTSIMDQSSLIASWYSKMQGIKSLTLHWRACLGHSDNLVEACLPWEAANSSIIDQSSLIAPWYSKMQGQKLLTLRWCSFSGHNEEVNESVFTWKRGRLFDCGLMSPHSPCIFHDAKPEVLDSPLTLIFRT